MARELTLLRFEVARRKDYFAWHEANKDIALYDIVGKKRACPSTSCLAARCMKS